MGWNSAVSLVQYLHRRMGLGEDSVGLSPQVLGSGGVTQPSGWTRSATDENGSARLTKMGAAIVGRGPYWSGNCADCSYCVAGPLSRQQSALFSAGCKYARASWRESWSIVESCSVALSSSGNKSGQVAGGTRGQCNLSPRFCWGLVSHGLPLQVPEPSSTALACARTQVKAMEVSVKAQASQCKKKSASLS